MTTKHATMFVVITLCTFCLLYTSDAADDLA